MKKRHFTSILALFAYINIIVASNITTPDVVGTVLDENGKPMPFANVVLLSSADSSFIMGVTSDDAGQFTIKVPDNKGILRVTSVGYDTRYINITSNKDMKHTIQMKVMNNELSNVTVKAAKPKTKLSARGMLTEISGSVLEYVGSAEDMLVRVPGLMKNKDGIEVIGKGSPIYYINGRKVRDMNELKRLRSNEILSVEVISNPGAQYDATVSAVVRIKTIRKSGDGLSFDVGAQDEQSLKIEDNNDQCYWLNANYRWNNVDIFAGGNYFEWSHRQQSNIMQQTYGTPSFLQDGILQYNMRQKMYGYKAGANWQINDKHSLGVKYSKNNTFHSRVNQTVDEVLFRNGTPIDSVLALGNHKAITDPYTDEANAYYNGSIGKLGIDFNIDYLQQKESELANTDEHSSFDHTSSVIGTESSSKNKLWATKLVLSYPIWKGQLQVGTEETFTRRDEDYTIFSDNANTSINTSKDIPSTNSKVKEDNIAAFVEYAFALPKVGQFAAGLRYEHVNYTYDSFEDKRDNVHNQTVNIESIHDDFFPSLSWATAFPTKGGSPIQLMASYSMKTVRPNFMDLNSAVRYHSRYVLQMGNAGLRNQTNHEAGINARYKIFALSAQYVCQEDAFSRWSEQYNDQGVVIVRACNLNDPVHNATIYLSANPTIGCWTLQSAIGLKNQWLKIDAKDPRSATGYRRLDFSNKPQIVGQIYNTFTFGGKTDGTNAWLIDFGGQLMGKGYMMNAKLTNNYFNLSAAVQKSFLKNNALVARFEINDILQTADYNISTDCGSHFIEQTNSFDYHRVKLSVTYSFNAARSKYKGTGAGKDAQERMKKQQ